MYCRDCKRSPHRESLGCFARAIRSISPRQMAPAYSRSLTRGVSRALAAKHSGRHLSTPRTGVTRLSRKWHKSWGFRATTLYGTRLCCVRCMLCTSRVRTNAEQTVRTTVTTHSSGQPSSTASIDTCTTGQAPRVGLNDSAWGLENYRHIHTRIHTTVCPLSMGGRVGWNCKSTLLAANLWNRPGSPRCV